MEKTKILNKFVILQKVEIHENSTVLFYFGDIPSWTKNEIVKVTDDLFDFYEVFEINFNLIQADTISLYWKVHRYIGEKFLVSIDENKMNIWNDDIYEYEEEWNFFDDLDDEFSIANYSKYNIPKTVQDWKTDYMKLEKRYYSLLIEKQR